MKKNTTKKVKKSTSTTTRARRSAAPVAVSNDVRTSGINAWSVSIYIYWFIILFFIAATFYIIGRGHDVMRRLPAAGDVAVESVENVTVTEEALMTSDDYFQAGKENLVAGNTTDAIADLSAGIDAGTVDPTVYILRGEAYMQSGDYSNARADFDTALEIDEMNSIAYYDRALLNIRLEDYNAALADINNAIAARVSVPNDVLQLRDLYAKRGQLNLWLKNWQGAVADYTNSLARPEGTVNPAVYAERAEAYTAMGEYQNAIDDYASAIRVISEQVQGAMPDPTREAMSAQAMGYFEKSAALSLALGNIDGARADLESAYTIAAALNDAESVERLTGLMDELQ